MVSLWAWALFLGFVLVMLALDLGVFNRKAHEVSVKEALTWSGVWIALALAFNAGIYFWLGREPAVSFLAGYVVEKALSVDNIFVFIMIFGYFRVPALYQHKVLFWGVLGALVMRGLFIAAGVTLITHFHWVMYVFGAFLVITAVKMLVQGDHEVDPEANFVLKLFRRFVPATSRYHGAKFLVRESGRLVATPLLATLIIVEVSDLVFAIDSIPAILAITNDPFIVFTSNVFAILGLRSLYFALAGVMGQFRFLKHGLAAILGFVGIKMLIADLYKIPVPLALGLIVAILVVAVVLSLVITPPPQSPVAASASPASDSTFRTTADSSSSVGSKPPGE